MQVFPSADEYAASLPRSGERGPLERLAIRTAARLEPKTVSCSDWHTAMTKMEIGKMMMMTMAMMMEKMMIMMAIIMMLTISMLKQHWSST